MTHNQLAKLCKESYLYKTFNVNECEGLLLRDEDVQIIVFRGTEAGALFSGAGWLDVLRDLRMMPWYDKDTGWVHTGFLKGALAVVDLLVKQLDPSLPVVCTGHSLGGALALMCAVKLQAKGFTIQEWVGFGSPKAQFTKKRFSFSQTNYRHRADVVPLMPRFTPYKHNYPQVSLRPDINLKPTWDDHSIDLYIKAVL